MNRLLLLEVRLAASSRFLRSMEALISAALLAGEEEDRELEDFEELLDDELREGALETDVLNASVSNERLRNEPNSLSVTLPVFLSMETISMLSLIHISEPTRPY